jgi:hypothetical protein
MVRSLNFVRFKAVRGYFVTFFKIDIRKWIK